MSGDSPATTHRRRIWPTVTGAALTLALVGSVTAVATSPSARDAVASAISPEAQAAQTATARADDLKGQLYAAQVSLGQVQSALGRANAVAGDGTQQARANDLKGQVDQLTAKIQNLSAAANKAESERAAAQARADDLARQLQAANARAGKAEGELASSRAAVTDLRQQVADLSGKAGQSKPTASQSASPVAPTPGAPAGPAKTYPVLTKPEIVKERGMLGLYTEQSPFFNGEFDSVEASINRDASVSGYFQSWATDFRPDVIQSTWGRGEIPLLTWESQNQLGQTTTSQPEFSDAQIISGRYDDYIRKYARDITANGQAFIMRFDHEMNGDWYPWGEGRKYDETSKRRVGANGNEPGSYVAMWRHVHDIFEAEGANQYVVWMWAPNRIDNLKEYNRTPEFLASLYPGDEVVDLVGMSGYDRYNYPATTDFDDVFGATLAQLKQVAPSKKIFLAEVGSAERAGRDKGAYIESLIDGMEADDDIVGFAWFNINTAVNTWKINSSADALAAFRQGIATSRFGRTR